MNKTVAARKVLQETDLSPLKPEVNAKKVRDKMATMLTTYRIWRQKAEAAWGVDPTTHNALIDAHHPEFGSIRTYLISKCSWFYEFEALFEKGPMVVPHVSESEQQDKQEVWVVHENPDQSAIGLTNWLRSLQMDNIINSRPVDKDKSYDSDSTTTGDEHLTNNPPSFENPSTRPSITNSGLRVPVVSLSKSSTPATTVPLHVRSKRRKRVSSIDTLFDSDNERVNQRTKRGRTVADALLEIEHIRDKRARREEALRMARFEAEQRQRDQHHEARMQQGRERLMRGEERLLRLEFAKQTKASI